MNKIISLLLGLSCYCLMGQVGIGTTDPQADLDVNGNFKLTNGSKLYLENPGFYQNTTSSSQMIVRDLSDNTLKMLNPETLPYSSVSFTTYFFDNVGEKGLVEYDTKIDASKFYVCIGGFRILKHDGNTSISLTGSTGNNGSLNYLPLYNARAFVKDGTWRLTFQPNSGRTFESNVDIYLNVSIYLKNFLTRTNDPIVVNLNGNTSGNGSAAAPVGAIP